VALIYLSRYATATYCPEEKMPEEINSTHLVNIRELIEDNTE